ncbi:MAG TPA: ABC transporter substrate-binding protein [Microbacteriaceae bacterium]|nr:ABC transporter substrate-binding protein [Microbacteriaceae bacterium]
MKTSSPPNKRTRRFFGVAIAATAALVLSACSSGASPAEDEAPADLVDSGQGIETVKVAFPGSLANLYIGQESGILNYYLAANVQEGLVSLDSEGKFVPGLATEWEMTDDSTYVFTVREDAKFHNGDTVTPEDIVFSIEQAADPVASPGTSFYLQGMASAEVTGDNEITVKTENPNASFLTNLSNVGALVVTQQAFWEEHDGKVGTSNSLLMGTGPYAVTEFSPDSHVVLDRVDTWWGEQPPVEQIRIDFIPDENTRLLAAQKGDIDIAFNVPLKQANSWQDISEGRVDAVNDLSYAGLLFDHEVAPFDDPNVRAAIATATDSEAIVEKLLHGYGEVATSIMTPESLSQVYDADAARDVLSNLPHHSFDMDRAKELLEDSSAADGFTTELTYPNTGPQLGTAAQSIAENMKQLGVTINVREVPIEEWLATIGDGEHGLGFMWYFSTTGDPAEVSSYLLGAGNDSHFDSAEAQRLIAESDAALDPADRVNILLQLEEENHKNTHTSPLWWGQSLTYFSNEIGIKDFSPFTFLGAWGPQLYAAE